jgi:hypothetical protein
MGHGIAQAFAQRNIRVRFMDTEQAAWDNTCELIATSLETLREEQILDISVPEALANIPFSLVFRGSRTKTPTSHSKPLPKMSLPGIKSECAGKPGTELPSSIWLPATLLYLFAANCLETSGLLAMAAALAG